MKEKKAWLPSARAKKNDSFTPQTTGWEKLTPVIILSLGKILTETPKKGLWSIKLKPRLPLVMISLNQKGTNEGSNKLESL